MLVNVKIKAQKFEHVIEDSPLSLLEQTRTLHTILAPGCGKAECAGGRGHKPNEMIYQITSQKAQLRATLSLPSKQPGLVSTFK